MQGQRIETPDYIRANNLPVDYVFYITNQIMKPVCQLFGIVVERLPGYEREPDYWTRMKSKLAETLEGDKLTDKLEALREADVKHLMFGPILEELGEKVFQSKDLLALPTPAPVRKSRAKKAV